MSGASGEGWAIACVGTAGLAVDADGAPDSYRVDGRGLSSTCDGVFAVVTVRANWRVEFRCERGKVWDVDLADYH